MKVVTLQNTSNYKIAAGVLRNSKGKKGGEKTSESEVSTEKGGPIPQMIQVLSPILM